MSVASSPAPVRRGMLDALPLIVGYLPFGFVLGATIAGSSVGDVAGWASSPLIFAGASQLAVVDLLDAGAGAVVIVATALVINLRHVMYSGALAPWFADSPTWWQLAAPQLLADPVYSLAAVRFETLPTEQARRRYYAAVGLTLYLAWAAMTAAGILVGSQLPATLDLGIAVPLVFLALLVPTVVDRPTLAAALVGGSVTLAGDPLPLHLGLIVGALAGIAAGVLFDPEV